MAAVVGQVVGFLMEVRGLARRRGMRGRVGVVVDVVVIVTVRVLVVAFASAVSCRYGFGYCY